MFEHLTQDTPIGTGVPEQDAYLMGPEFESCGLSRNEPRDLTDFADFPRG